LTEISDFNETLGTEFSDEEFSTIGGLIVSRYGHIPKRGESIMLDNLRITALRTDSRRLHSVIVEIIPPAEEYPTD
ncbi:MAG: transporter associated domain-containing protein, partial [Methylophilaceae bacterium]